MRTKILTKESVLDAAEKIIVGEGMNHCSMRRISGILGVAVGTLYNYYGSREELLIDLFTISWQRTIEKVQRVINPERQRKDQIIEFIHIIEEDVMNRNGLGKEIYIFNSYIKVVDEKALNIRNELSRQLGSILNQKKGMKQSNEVLCRWMIVLLVDALINERKITQEEIEMFVQLIEVEFELG